MKGRRVRLDDEQLFTIETGLWTGERGPLQTVAVLRNTNFRCDGRVDYSNVARVAVETRKLEKRVLRPGDIIVERSGGSPKQPVGRVAFFEGDGTATYSFSNFTARVRVNDWLAVDPKYLHYHLLALHVSGGTVLLQHNTTGIRNLRFRDYCAQEIHLPPIDRQKAIASGLSTIQEAVSVQERLVAALRDLKRATIDSLFLGVDGWADRRLDACATIQTGIAKCESRDGEDYISLPYLRVANVQDGRFDLTEIKTIRVRSTKVDRYRVLPGDVLLTEGGDFDKLGRGHIWRGEIAECVHQNHIFVVRVDPSVLLPEFFTYLVQSAYGKRYFLSVAHKTTNLACINSSKLKRFPVRLPPLDRQREIASGLTTIDQALDTAARKSSVTATLFLATLQRLLKEPN